MNNDDLSVVELKGVLVCVSIVHNLPGGIVAALGIILSFFLYSSGWFGVFRITRLCRREDAWFGLSRREVGVDISSIVFSLMDKLFKVSKITYISSIIIFITRSNFLVGRLGAACALCPLSWYSLLFLGIDWVNIADHSKF
ncbi:unnamed protein product [Cochlearia groenlandica]